VAQGNRVETSELTVLRPRISTTLPRQRRSFITGMGCTFAALALPSCRRKRFGPVTGYEGVLAPHSPVQRLIEPAVEGLHHGAELTLFASFSLTALVLSSRMYRDRDSAVMPLDLALGWGGMSDPSLLQNVEIWQGGRWYYWRHGNVGPLPDDISGQSANMHMIPASQDILAVLRDLRPGNVVHFDGMLCDVTTGEGISIRSSRTRNDTGAGSCEIDYVTKVETLI